MESGAVHLIRPSFGEFLKLGIEHILTGLDHLLFLGALLVGVQGIRSMLGIITCFTVAHSVTFPCCLPCASPRDSRATARRRFPQG